ncbi:MAG: hypothetical protein V1735_07385 [Nanoarchaeota archaeon]
MTDITSEIELVRDPRVLERIANCYSTGSNTFLAYRADGRNFHGVPIHIPHMDLSSIGLENVISLPPQQQIDEMRRIISNWLASEDGASQVGLRRIRPLTVYTFTPGNPDFRSPGDHYRVVVDTRESDPIGLGRALTDTEREARKFADVLREKVSFEELYDLNTLAKKVLPVTLIKVERESPTSNIAHVRMLRQKTRLGDNAKLLNISILFFRDDMEDGEFSAPFYDRAYVGTIDIEKRTFSSNPLV